MKSLRFEKGMYPEAERIGLGTITLPLYPRLTKKEQQFVVDEVIRVVTYG
jgi:dTDP-4-amino-4,6-dideoxygalactose transaminase